MDSRWEISMTVYAPDLNSAEEISEIMDFISLAATFSDEKSITVTIGSSSAISPMTDTKHKMRIINFFIAPNSYCYAEYFIT
jgi:hypothetical protein